MIFADFKKFVTDVPPAGRVLGVDWGAKRVGLAVSDASREFVFPREIVDNAPIDSIVNIVDSERIVGIVVGLPKHADGSDSETTAKVREFAKELAAATDTPIAFIDEKLTSVAAREIKSAISNHKSAIDAAAAAVILEDAVAMMKRIGYV